MTGKNEYLALFERTKPVLIMSLPYNEPALCQAAFAAGADVVKVHLNVDHHASGTHFGSLAEERPRLEEMLAHRKGPMGVVPGADPENISRDLEALKQLPFSFCSVYAHHLPAYAVESPFALMAACDSTYTLDEIREMPAIGADVVEASIIPGGEYGQRLSMRDLLKYRAITRLVDVPVVVPTQRVILPEEVKQLVRAGVRGIMIGAVVTGKTEQGIAEAVRAFRRAIDEE